MFPLTRPNSVFIIIISKKKAHTFLIRSNEVENCCHKTRQLLKNFAQKSFFLSFGGVLLKKNMNLQLK